MGMRHEGDEVVIFDEKLFGSGGFEVRLKSYSGFEPSRSSVGMNIRATDHTGRDLGAHLSGQYSRNELRDLGKALIEFANS